MEKTDVKQETYERIRAIFEQEEDGVALLMGVATPQPGGGVATEAYTMLRPRSMFELGALAGTLMESLNGYVRDFVELNPASVGDLRRGLASARNADTETQRD